MQHNSPLIKQTIGQNKICTYHRLSHEIHKQMNQTFRKMNLWQVSHANGNTKISSIETLLGKELMLVILQL